MSNRSKTVPSLVFAAFLASVVSTAIACVAARAADDCLNEPKHQTRPGGHWYYRIDRSDHRKCWYLRDEGQHVSRSGSPLPLASSSPPAPWRQPAAAIQTSLADAHAELPMVTTAPEPPQWFILLRFDIVHLMSREAPICFSARIRVAISPNFSQPAA